MTEEEFLKCDLSDVLESIRNQRKQEFEDAINNPEKNKDKFVTLEELNDFFAER